MAERLIRDMHKEYLAWWRDCRYMSVLFLLVGLALLGIAIWQGVLATDGLDVAGGLVLSFTCVPLGASLGVAIAVAHFNWHMRRWKRKE